ncbi:MAG: hypothetical protein RBS17_00145 [Coriobacteriia bacterium]|nr:hypothetical protein [Coriobacteriia bacterium]
MMFLGVTQGNAVRARFHMAAYLLAGVSTADGLARETGVSRGIAVRFVKELLEGGYVSAQPVADADAALAYEFTKKGCGYLQGELERWVRSG